MIEAGDLRTGATLKVDNNLYRVTNVTYNKPGRGKASMKTVLMDLRTGQTVQRVFGVDEKLDNIFVEAEQVDYLYRDGNLLNFMNQATYDQYEASADLFGNDVLYLKEGMQIELRMHEGLAIDYKLPTSVTYTVAEADVAVAGDTSGKVTKKVTTETGLVVQVPIFVSQGDSIQVDTRDGSYLGRG